MPNTTGPRNERENDTPRPQKSGLGGRIPGASLRTANQGCRRDGDRSTVAATARDLYATRDPAAPMRHTRRDCLVRLAVWLFRTSLALSAAAAAAPGFAQAPPSDS